MLQQAGGIERFRSVPIPIKSEASIVMREAESHQCEVIPDVTERRVRGERGIFMSQFVRTTTLYINRRRCLLKRANIPAERSPGARVYAHFDFRNGWNKDKEFVILRVASNGSSTFYIVKVEELLEWYGEDAPRISLGIPVPEYPIAYCHAAFDWASYKDNWKAIEWP